MTAQTVRLDLHHSATVKQPAWKRCRRAFTHPQRLLHTLAVVLSLTIGLLPAHATTPGKTKTPPASAHAKADPLQGDVWHALGTTWPGTLAFDGKTKTVVLAPVGAPAIRASYTVTGLAAKGAAASGSLRMVSIEGQTVEATFEMKDRKTLSLRFKAGQRDETYVRMTPAEEVAEKSRLTQLVQQRQAGKR